MEKLTIDEFIKLTADDILKEVYAKLVALRMEYIIHSTTEFNSESFEVCYKVATETVEKAKFTKFQLCCFIVGQAKELEDLGFTRQHLFEVASLDI